MKKFKHKESNVEAHQTDKVSYSLFVNKTCIGMANAWMIEGNEDWIEITTKVTRTPILTSEDGVELFEGGEAFCIYKLSKKCKINSATILPSDPVGGYLYFSTREAAEEYREDNARVLSLYEAMRHKPDQLKELVKSRL